MRCTYRIIHLLLVLAASVVGLSQTITTRSPRGIVTGRANKPMAGIQVPLVDLPPDRAF